MKQDFLNLKQDMNLTDLCSKSHVVALIKIDFFIKSKSEKSKSDLNCFNI